MKWLSRYFWRLRMCWRDSRQQKGRLFLCAASILCGVAAVVALQSFGHNLERAIDVRSRALLGADLEFTSNTPLSEQALEWIDQWGIERASEVRLTAMAVNIQSGRSRLVQLRGLEGAFPFYGTIDTVPAGLRPDAQRKEVLVEENLLAQLELEVGEVMRIGQDEFYIAGRLLRLPGEAGVGGVFAPRVVLHRAHLAATGLLQPGSIARYHHYVRMSDAESFEATEADRQFLAQQRLRLTTVEDRQRQLGDTLDQYQRYLQVSALIALLFGGLGVAGSVHTYLSEKRSSVAVLRCLGARGTDAAGIFSLQMMGVALIASLAGVVVGLCIQRLIPVLAESFLPMDIEVFVSWRSVATGIVLGTSTAWLFAQLALRPLRAVSPLAALRKSVETGAKNDRWLYVWGALMLAALALAYSVWLTGEWLFGLYFTGALLCVVAVLVGLTWLLRGLLRRLLPSEGQFVLRQAVSSLYRPQNRTLFLMMTLGAGATMIVTLYLIEACLLSQADWNTGEEVPNLLVWDIQEDERPELLDFFRHYDLPIHGDAPVLTLRLVELKSRPVEDWLSGDMTVPERWTLTREYRTSYRDQLQQGEELVAGELYAGEVLPGEDIPISLEMDFAAALGVELGDSLVFEWFGQRVPTRVASLRKVDWRQLRPNFFVLFPPGVLEAMPAFHIVATRLPDRETALQLQQELQQRFPTVAMIDLTLILDTLTTLLQRARIAVQFLASFTVLTGLIVLVGAVVASRYQRGKEVVLLRTLGASRRSLFLILVIEFGVIGLLGSAAGFALGSAIAFTLARHYFDAALVMPGAGAALLLALMSILTIVAGCFAGKGLTRTPPLEVLRQEE